MSHIELKRLMRKQLLDRKFDEDVLAPIQEKEDPAEAEN
jgi:hypothetical protein